MKLTKEQVEEIVTFLKYTVDGCEATYRAGEVMFEAGGPCVAFRVAPEQRVTSDDVDLIAAASGVDMNAWREACEAEMFDDDGMPVVSYPPGAYDRINAVLQQLHVESASRSRAHKQEGIARLRPHSSKQLEAFERDLEQTVREHDTQTPKPGRERAEHMLEARQILTDDTIDELAGVFGLDELGEPFEDARISLRSVLMAFCENWVEAHDDWAYQGESETNDPWAQQGGGLRSGS